MLLYGLFSFSDHFALSSALPAVARDSFSSFWPVCNPRQWQSAEKQRNETAFSRFLLSPRSSLLTQWIALTVTKLLLWLFFQTDAARLLCYIWMHFSNLLIHISPGWGLSRISKGQTTLHLLSSTHFHSADSHCMLLPPSLSPNCSVPQHFCLLCQVPQTSASSALAPVLKNVSGKSLWLEWLSPPETYSSLFWSFPSTTPLPSQVSGLKSLVTSGQPLFVFLYFPFHCSRL